MITHCLACCRFLTCLNLQNLQYYLEKNLDARQRELEREAELEDKAPKVKAKSRMSKVKYLLVKLVVVEWNGVVNL